MKTSNHQGIPVFPVKAFTERPAFQSLPDFNAYMKRLYSLALPSERDKAFFNTHMQIASDYGMNYREGLEFVIRIRQGGAD